MLATEIENDTVAPVEQQIHRHRPLTGAIPTSRPRRVLYMDHTAQLGGGEIALLNLAMHLDPKRYVPIVVVFSDGPVMQSLMEAGIETHLIPLSPGVVEARKDVMGGRSLLQIKDVISAVAFIRRLVQFIRLCQPDVVHTNSLKSDILGGFAAKWARVPLLWHLRDRIADDYLPKIVVRIFRALAQRVPDYVVAVSMGSLKTLFAEPITAVPARMRIVYDGTPDLLELPATHDDAPPPDPNRPALVGLVGRISRWKGQHIYLRAAARVLRRFPNVRFQIVGSPMFGQEAYEQELRDLSRALGIEDHVEFTGFRTDVKAAIGALDVVVHASIIGEPFGQVTMEGMAQGKPIIATNGGGMPEVIDDKVTGLLVPMADDAAMATAIETLLADPAASRRMGRRGWERVRDRFTSDIVARNIQEVYDEMLNVEASTHATARTAIA